MRCGLPQFAAAFLRAILTLRRLAKQATFHSGYPLASTLWTCNYLRADSLAVISGFAPSTSATENDERSKLRTVVLRALFLAVLKSNQIVWEELSKNQVYEVCLSGRFVPCCDRR